MSRAWLATLFLAVTSMLGVDVRADGGTVRAQESVGAFTMTVFTSPDPLAAGPLDVSVLVQDRADGAPILDGRVTLRLASRSDVGDGDRMLEATATHDAAANKLLYATWIDVGAGEWVLRAIVHRGSRSSTLDVPLSVRPATKRSTEYWPYVLLPPVAILVFALHQHLVEARRASA